MTPPTDTATTAPDTLSSVALNGAARAAAGAGRPAKALELFAHSLAADPAQVGVLKELAAVAARAGRRDEAIEIAHSCFRRCAGNLTAQLRIAFVLQALGAQADAVAAVVALAAHAAPGDARACARALSWLVIGLDPRVSVAAAALALCVEHGQVSAIHGGLFSAIYRDRTDLAPLAARRTIDALMAAPTLCDDLFLRGLTQFTVTDIALERVLVGVRATLVGEIDAYGKLPDACSRLRRLLAALAQQCFTNEYIWEETGDDRARCARLEALIAKNENGLADLHDAVAAVACFRPLTDLTCAEVLAAAPPSGDDGWDGLLRRQVKEPLRERTLAAGITALGKITNPISLAVRDQYQEHPYPRWITAAPAEPTHLPQPSGIAPLPPGARMDVLVAGCGTGLQAIQVAGQFPGARILAVDLSRAGLAYALRKTEERGVGRIAYFQADILNLGQLNMAFDCIESGGVPHHLENPAAGLAVLAGLLKPNGMMRLALYSKIARRAIIAAQELRASQGIPGDLDGIRRFRQQVFALPADHPAAGAANTPDMFAASECRDLLFHVQEICFDIPGVQRLLADRGLVFAGFDNLPRQTQLGYLAAYPDDPGMMSLANWDAFERANPAVFITMYQFWAFKNPDAQPILNT